MSASFAQSLPAFSLCMKRWPRVTAALMRCGYLTEQEAAIVVRDYIRKREGWHALPSAYWTELDPVNLRDVIRDMRIRRSWLLGNLISVRRYLAHS